MIYNQNPEQLARDRIDGMLLESGWVVQSKKQLNLAAASGVAIREYNTDIGPADYVLFVGKKPAGIIEAKREDEGVRLTMHEDQAEGYANAELRLLKLRTHVPNINTEQSHMDHVADVSKMIEDLR